jgi:hypothetical protein
MKTQNIFLSKNHYEYSIDDIEDSLEIIQSNGITTRLISALYTELYYKVYYEFYINKDIKQARQDSYLTCRLFEINVILFNKNISGFLLNFPVLMLHNNINMYTQLSNLRNNEYEEDRLLKDNSLLLIQSVLRNDYKEAIFLLSNFKTTKVININLSIDFFNALMSGAEDLMIDAIYKMLEKKEHKKRTKHFMLNDILSEPVLIYVKLAYIKGFKLKIDHPLIPNELLDMTPNDNYWEYDFMKKGRCKNI